MTEELEILQIPETELVEPTQRAADAKKKLVRLDGLALTEDGKLTKTKFFNFLKTDIEDYSDIALTEEQAQLVSRHLRYLSTGLNAVVPIFCGGKDKCPFIRTCPMDKVGKVPLGRLCPVEVSLTKLWTEAYVREFDVDPANFSELSLVQELAELDIYDRRATILLQEGEGQTLMQQQAVGVDPDGNPVYQTQVHQAWEIKERIKNRKLRILEALVGTRKEKYRRDAALKQKSSSDPSSELAALRARLETMRQEADSGEEHMDGSKNSGGRTMGP